MWHASNALALQKVSLTDDLVCLRTAQYAIVDTKLDLGDPC